MIIIVSTAQDLHALAVMRAVRGRGRQDCAIFAADGIGGRPAIYINVDHRQIKAEFRSTCSTGVVGLADARAIWWRRPFVNQVVSSSHDAAAKRFIDQECSAALLGLTFVAFKGKWISDPANTLHASNKLLQLRVALELGCRFPKTLISQSREEVLGFYEQCHGQVIVKSLAGVAEPMLFTRALENPNAFDDTVYSTCPAIYQERVPGHRHMRLCCFGDRAFAAIIESDELDWRPNLNVPVYAYDVPAELQQKASLMLQRLGLEMGIFDLKETPHGDWVWLEVNPQGQFLFLEPLTNLPLAEYFADFLIQSAEGARAHA